MRGRTYARSSAISLRKCAKRRREIEAPPEKKRRATRNTRATLGGHGESWRERDPAEERPVAPRCATSLRESGSYHSGYRWRTRARAAVRNRTGTGDTHGHPIRIFPSDLLALGLPLFERVLLLVLELHCSPSARGSRAGDDGDGDPFLDPSRPSPSFLACPFVHARARTHSLSLSRSPRQSLN